MIGPRSPEFEEAFIHAAEREAQHTGLGVVRRATHRLSEGQSLHGDRWADMSLTRLLHELEEEAIDLTTWGALAAQKLLTENRDPEQAQIAQARLVEVASHGIRALAAIRQVHEACD